MKHPDLILFARQPLPGQVKTRLQPPYSPERAAEIARFMIQATVEQAVANWPSQVYLYASPNADLPFFRELAAEFHVHLAAQSGADLGERMLNALGEGMRRTGAAAVMGTDIPHCCDEIIERAHESLARGGSVIGPTEDGGYYLIGLQQAEPGLFRDIAWGAGGVLRTTLERAHALGIELERLPPLRDVDTVDDLWLVARTYPPLKPFLGG